MTQEPELNPVKRYPSRTQPFDGESYQSFRLRFAARTIQTADALDRFLYKRSRSATWFTQSSMLRYSQLTGLTLDQVRRMMPSVPVRRHDYRMSTLLGHEFYLSLMELRSRRICPDCIRQAPYHRAIWSIYGARACEEHRVTLISDCPKCGEPLTWRTKTPIMCGECGFDLAKAPSTPHQHDVRKDAPIYFLQRLLLGTLDLPEGMADLTPYEFLSICQLVQSRFLPRQLFSSPAPAYLYSGFQKIIGDRERLILSLKLLAKPWLIEPPPFTAQAVANMRNLQQMLEAKQRGKWMLDVLDRTFNDFPYHLEWRRGDRGPNVKPEVIAYHREQDRQSKERLRQKRDEIRRSRKPKRRYRRKTVQDEEKTVGTTAR